MFEATQILIWEKVVETQEIGRFMNTNGGKTLKQRLILWSNRLRFDINVQRKGRFAQVIFPERFKSFVRTIKIVLTLIGLTSAFFFFQSIFVSFLFGLGIYLLITAFDKLVFSYNSLYVHLLPDFEIEPEKWLGAFFGYAEDTRITGHTLMARPGHCDSEKKTITFF